MWKKIRQLDRDFLSNAGEILIVMSLMMSSEGTQDTEEKIGPTFSRSNTVKANEFMGTFLTTTGPV